MGDSITQGQFIHRHRQTYADKNAKERSQEFDTYSKKTPSNCEADQKIIEAELYHNQERITTHRVLHRNQRK